MHLKTIMFALALFWPVSVAAMTNAEARTKSDGQESAAPGEEQPAFGQRLVDAARAQSTALVIYDPSYRKIEYPMGDVPWYTGVCTDVVVRAYRTLGIDLQPLVHKARVGSGDRNIDHRRVLVLKKFFKRKGISLPISKNGDDYLPGDLVTYYVPDGTFSKTHIAIVSDRKTWAGTPMVVHNRGFGVQEEDWLFAAKITGHFRYEGRSNIKGYAGK
ncbi:MAG: DUF1287 domain-containing protein [Pseudomonadota bacterium]